MSSAAKYLDDLEASLGRSDKAISALTEEIRILKSSLGEEVGLRHIFWKNSFRNFRGYYTRFCNFK